MTEETIRETETLSFQAEVGRLLDIVANALYSEKEIFLRELISNAADACDRIRYKALTDPDLLDGNSDFGIQLATNLDAGTLTITDNGSGMSRDELVNNLGTIARSGTSAFMEQLSEADRKGSNLIGQFGVGFYSAFMVATKVEVTSRAAGSEESWSWVSDGRGEFTLSAADRQARGTDITLHLKDDAKEYLEEQRLRHIVKTYSNHIPFPIKMEITEEVEGALETRVDQLNDAGALWRKNKSEVTEEQYKEFYHHVSHAFDDPLTHIHFRAEGMIEYSGLIYIPTERPYDLFHPDRMNKMKLYVKRVFITDECEELVPSWLRFLRGVVDSEDLPLNVSREMLQNNPVLSKIRSGLVKRVLDELAKLAENDAEKYATFWKNFGAVLKEGLYEHGTDRDKLLKVARFESTNGDGLTSLADYVSHMKDGQDSIFYITGENRDALANSPQLEGFKAKGVEVLFMTDPVDDFWLSSVGQFEEKSFKSVTRSGSDLASIKGEDKKDEEEDKKDDTENSEEFNTLIAALKVELGDAVADIRKSDRLTNSAVCLVADDNGMDMHMERLLAQHKQLDQLSKRVLEINAEHELIQMMGKLAGKGEDLSDAGKLLLDQARILEGETLQDPVEFAARLTRIMTKAVA